MSDGFNPERNENLEARLDELFRAYRSAFPEPGDPGDFMPRLWARIESRRESQVVFTFRRWTEAFVGLAAAASLFIMLLQVLPATGVQAAHGVYLDQLSEEAGPVHMLYQDMARAQKAPTLPPDFAPDGTRRR